MVNLKWIQGQRKTLCSNLAEIIDVAKIKFDNDRAANNERRAWARLIITGIEVYAKLLELSTLEDLAARVERLEETRGGAANVENNVKK
jgi:hypothetical protein